MVTSLRSRSDGGDTPQPAASRRGAGTAAPDVLVAIPVYNEAATVGQVVSHVLEHVPRVLMVDDGSTDGTPAILARHPVTVLRHATNQGYGRSLRDAFSYAAARGHGWVITMDCDEQHEPDCLPAFIEAIARNEADIISGSRYMIRPAATTATEAGQSLPVPADRRAINAEMTREINERLGLGLTDSFCGFKAHRVSSLSRLELTEDGYAFPMQLWAQAAAAGLRVREIPVPLIYKDLNRSFGARLDDPAIRLMHYRRVLHCELARQRHRLPDAAGEQLIPCG